MKAKLLISTGILVLVLCFFGYGKNPAYQDDDTGTSLSPPPPLVPPQVASESASRKKAVEIEIANATAAVAPVKTTTVPDIKG